jgi:secretion/DNA translocation related TadE-like protein
VTSSAIEERGRDRGSATIWTVSLGLVLWAAATAALLIGSALVARHRAESAADLAALAGARAALAGGDACLPASRVAAAVGARIGQCRAEADGVVFVVAEVTLPGVLPRWADMPPARARARAGGAWSLSLGALSFGALSSGAVDS